MATPVLAARAGSPRPPVPVIPAGEYGLCYGTKTSHPPTPDAVVDYYKSHCIYKMWISPTNADVISILDKIIADPELKYKMKVAVGTDDPSQLFDYRNAKEWVDNYIARFVSVISHVCVGDVIGSVDFTSPMLKGAMSNLSRLLSDPIKDHIKVCTFVNESILLGPNYTTNKRPSTCVLTESAKDLLRFQSNLFGYPIPLFVRIMPYFRIVPDNIPVNNCLLNDGAPIYMHDNVDKEYSYKHAFDAMVDSICCALEKVDGLGIVHIHVVSGWPTDGPTVWSKPKYSKQYIPNLVHHIGVTTPRGNKPVDIFIYALVDEDQLETSVEEFKHLGVVNLL